MSHPRHDVPHGAPLWGQGPADRVLLSFCDSAARVRGSYCRVKKPRTAERLLLDTTVPGLGFGFFNSPRMWRAWAPIPLPASLLPGWRHQAGGTRHVLATAAWESHIPACTQQPEARQFAEKAERDVSPSPACRERALRGTGDQT